MECAMNFTSIIKVDKVMIIIMLTWNIYCVINIIHIGLSSTLAVL